MPLETLFISGPCGAGKGTVARLVVDHALSRPAHYLRLMSAADGHTNAIVTADEMANGPIGNGWASMHLVTYTGDRVFETLPEGLRCVRRIERNGFVVVEADSDPVLRHAFPYDYRVFVMPAPDDVFTVFRGARAAADALQQVMQDTAAFASEIFGLFDGAGLDDSVGVEHRTLYGRVPGAASVEQLDISETQIRQFLNSPLGAEIASRIQLQPEYHGLVESDIVVVNTGVGGDDQALDACVERIEKLLARVRHDTRRHSVLYWGDIRDSKDPTYYKLLRRLRTLLAL